MKVRQDFNPRLKVYKEKEIAEIPEKTWAIDEMGSRQIEEVWKHYKGEIYVSNYGYVAEMSQEDAKNIFGEKFNDFQTEKGVAFRKLGNDQKNFIRKKNFVPENWEDSNCEIWLYVSRLGFKEGQVHKMVAEKFLHKPQGKDIVHHIDNNSYNNSVTNLIYLDSSEHTRAVHPMSY